MWPRSRRSPLLVLGVFLCAIPAVRSTVLVVDARTPYAADDGACSIIEAIDNANDDAVTHADCPAGSGADRIDLRQHVVLDGSTVFTPDVATGLPSITSALTIDGDLKLIARDPAAPAFRLLHVAAGGDLTLIGVAVQGGLLDSGFVSGGGIFVDGQLTLDHVIVRNNTVSGIFPSGGGLHGSATSSITLIDSQILDNVADNLDPDMVFDDGGGIRSFGDLSLIGTRVVGNRAAENGGGVISQGTANIENSIIENNQAGLVGGGLAAVGTLVLVDSRIGGNTAEDDGGGLYVNATAEMVTTVIDGNATTGTVGGGAYQFGASPLTVRASSFENNRAEGTAVGGGFGSSGQAVSTFQGTTFRGNLSESNGGGLFTVSSTITLEDCLIEQNQAVNGGGLFQSASNVGGFRIHRSTIRDNTADTFGGGLYCTSPFSTAMLFNSTVTGNTAFSAGGGIMLNSGGLLALTHVTVSENESEEFINSVGGVSAFAGEMSIGSSVIAGNLPVDCSATSSSTSLDYNITLGPSGGLPADRWCSFIDLQPNDLTDTDPLLAPLADLGNLGPAYRPMPGSPAIGAVPTDCPASLSGVDQRGVPRDAGSCDVGAISGVDVDLPTISFLRQDTLIDDEGSQPGPHSVDLIVDHPAGGLAAPGSVPLTVAIRVTGSATRTVDFELGVAHPAALVFDAGNWPAPGTRQTVSLPITVLDDQRAELDEEVQLELIVYGPGRLDPAARHHVFTIIDDDGFIFADSLEDAN